MAHSSVSLRVPSRLTRPSSEAELALRHLKSALHQRFEPVRSAHLSEALAACLGFNTNAALVADMAQPYSAAPFHKLNLVAFRARLVEFGYPYGPDLSFNAPASPAPSASHLQRLARLREMELAPNGQWDQIYTLRNECAAEFARAFGLGRLQDREDARVVHAWPIGVDHGACLPRWGTVINSQNGGTVDFAGIDHRAVFEHFLPVRDGKLVAYQSALVSMPYVGRSGRHRDFDQAAAMAAHIGWTCSEHPEWSWYAPGSTALVLFKRTTPHETTARDWEHSFLRWAVEHRKALSDTASATRLKLLEDICSDAHLPMDLKDFEDCRERYFKEFAPHMYDNSEPRMVQVFERLMMKWQGQRSD